MWPSEDTEKWLRELKGYRNFFAHRRVIDFKSCNVGTYTFSGYPRSLYAPAYNYPLYTGEKIKVGDDVYDEYDNILLTEPPGTFHVANSDGIEVHQSLAEAIRKHLNIEKDELDKMFDGGLSGKLSYYVDKPIIVLADPTELDKHPAKEILRFSDMDVRDLCSFYYDNTKDLLGNMYKLLIGEWKSKLNR